ncbi:MAG: RdgB/HAM1 family non-canonical purine NTP pyrophosphatase [Anaerolineae bacterium]|nr:RdgB/HAM1 family non-canonical purine NTP pyrophosphatase [Anaerolineae bacterium]
MITVLVATLNPGKQREYHDLLANLPVTWVGPADVGLDHLEVAEDGLTFEANARLKALAFARASGLPTLADDSGLQVDALNGQPGVYSARYAGPAATDEDRYRKLLSVMAAIPDDRRSARFVCVVALALPDGEVHVAQGTLEGSIGRHPRGSGGFGYDPVFVLPDGRHLAELSAMEKNAISHRARALEALRPILLAVLERLQKSGAGW